MGSQVGVRDHRAEQQREVGQREQIQLQGAAPIGPAVQAHGARDEGEAQRERGREVDASEAPGAERQLV